MAAFVEAVGVVRRGVDVDDQLGAGRRLRRNGSRGVPDVLADGHADPDPADQEQLLGARTGTEVPLLVEDRIVGQRLLAVDAVHLAEGADGGGVVEVGGLVDEADHGGAAPRGRGHLVEVGLVVGDEARLQQEILRGVARDGQLPEDGQVGPGLLGHGQGVDDHLGVARQVTDDGVELAQGHTETTHTPKRTKRP
jgi:hypothetical protein